MNRSKLVRQFRISVLLVFTFIGTLGLLPDNALAASSSLYLSPGSKSVVKGATLSVGVRVNPGGDPINAVQANLAYPADKLDFLSISTGGSAFEIQAENSGGGGNIRIARGTLSNVTTDKLVATLNFKAKVDSGTASINFSDGSSVVRATDNANTLASTAGGNYKLAAPAPVAPPPPPPPADTTAPVISAVVVTSIGYHTVTITWKTNEPATSFIDYGLDKNYGVLAQAEGRVTDHKVTITSPLLVPGVSYHFKARSADAAGNTTSSDDSTFNMRGYKIQINVVDGQDEIIKNAAVKLGDQSIKTNEQGAAIFENQYAGERLVQVAHNGKTIDTGISIKPTVLGETEPAAQTFTIKVVVGNNFLPFFVGLGLLLLVAIAVLVWVFHKRRKDEVGNVSQSESYAPSNTLTPPTNDFQPGAHIQPTTAEPQSSSTTFSPGTIIQPNSPGEHSTDRQ